jgi:hypothetical protein
LDTAAQDDLISARAGRYRGAFSLIFRKAYLTIVTHGRWKNSHLSLSKTINAYVQQRQTTLDAPMTISTGLQGASQPTTQINAENLTVSGYLHGWH